MKHLLTFVLSCLLTSSAFGALAQKPNFVVIFIDDLGYADIGPFGATKQKTPHLDRMAREGMKLTSFYAAPVCSVSRAMLLTGCYGPRVSVPGVYFPGQKNGLSPAEFTIAERLKALGYETACIGKWHLGDQPEFLPTNQGFDRYFGIPYSNDMQRKALGGSERVTPLLRDDKVAELLTDEQQSLIVERYTDEAIRFMRDSKDKPFFLYYAHTAVHTPIYPGKAFQGKSDNGRFGDWVEEVDWSVGRVLDTLKELKLDDNTLVIFTSDNGPWLDKRDDGGSALPLRGGKGSTWEGGMRVPTVARWPGKVKPSSVSDAVAGTIDLLPTFVTLAGGTVPAEPIIDGRDLSPVLLGKTTEAPREAHYYFLGYNLQAVRQGPWKLAIAPQRETMRENILGDAKKTPRLYNLADDISEKTDLAEKHPEIVARLKALATAIEKEIGGNAPAARRPAGQVENPKLLYAVEQPAPQPTKTPDAKKHNEKPVDLAKLKPGEVVTTQAAPTIADRAFTVSLTVETGQSDTVFLSHGGSAVGYAIHLRGGKVVFVIRHGDGDNFTELTSPDVFKGKAKITATLAADRTMSLTVDGKVVATAKAKSLIPRQPMEEFCLGHDSMNPVTSYTAREPFKGSITDLQITTP